MKPLTLERLREVINYDPATGAFTWIRPTSSRVRPGGVAGTINHDGYRVIAIDRFLYRAGRLAWFYTHGEWPADQIDHINADRLDDRISNLREATWLENLRYAHVRRRARKQLLAA